MIAKRMNNLSAPGIITVFLLICLLVVYGMETLGLSNKEHNVEMRVTNLNLGILFIFYSYS